MSKRKLLLGLIGANIMGSLSPALFADAFMAAEIDGFYHLMDVDRLLERRLAKLLDAVKATGFAGANITYPFKQEVIALLDAVDPEAAQIGAVNTVAIGPEGRTTGYNFDRRGWRHSFEESLGRSSAKDATVVLVGAGGAGRAVAFALMDLGVAILVIHDCDGTRANALNADIASNYGASRCRVSSDLERDIAAAQGVLLPASGCPPTPIFIEEGAPTRTHARTYEIYRISAAGRCGCYRYPVRICACNMNGTMAKPPKTFTSTAWISRMRLPPSKT
jgi:shikimate dehydrogenase